MLAFPQKLIKLFRFFFKREVYYSAIDKYQILNSNFKCRAGNRASPEGGR